MVELSVIRDLVAIFGVIAGFSYYVMTVRNQSRSRQAQMFMQLYGNYMTTEYITYVSEALRMEYTDYDDFQKKYSRLPQRLPYTKQCFFLDGIAVLVEEGLLDIKLVAKLISGDIMWHWNHFRPYILEARERRNHPEYMYYIEYLYNEVVKVRPGHSQIIKKLHPELKT